MIFEGVEIFARSEGNTKQCAAWPRQPHIKLLHMLLTIRITWWTHVTLSSYVLKHNVSMTNEMHNSYNQFLFHRFLSALHASNESSRSSSGARHNILYYAVWYNRYNRAVSTTVPIVLCNTVYYAVLLMMND